MEQLKYYTEKLILHLEMLEQVYHKENTSKDDRHFFEYVQEKTKPIFTELDAWNEAVLVKIERQEMYFPIALITTTNKNMKALIMHSYYQDVRKRRYMEIKHSCFYVFNKLLGEMQRGKKEID